MKYINYLIIILAISLFSCNDWLDIDPKSETGEEELFSDANGFRNAINGIYMNCASTKLYGKEATWGCLDAYAQYYLTTIGYIKKALKYDFENTSIKNINEDIWKKAYNTIANCNNLIDNIHNTPVTDFLEKEKEMLEGEALGIRAYLYFDLLRLYVSYEDIKNDGLAIPYPKHKSLMPSDRLNVSEVIKNIKEDLVRASELLIKVDTTAEVVDDMDDEIYRFYTCSRIPEFAYRGLRFNYYASLALLARVNSYIGEKEEAYKWAKKLTDYDLFEFSDDASGSLDDRDVKLIKGVIFGLHDIQLTEHFDAYTKKGDYYFIFLKGMDELFTDVNDIRFKGLIDTKKYGGSEYYYSLKHISSDIDNTERDKRGIIPMLRLSEMYYIMSEYLFTVDKEKAFDLMDELRLNRGVLSTLDRTMSEQDFIEELVLDARREFISEGQMFYLYKRLNHAIKAGTQTIEPEDIKFTLPYPVCENF
jgi:hypothetical protein